VRSRINNGWITHVTSHLTRGRGHVLLGAIAAFLFAAAVYDDFLAARQRSTLQEVAQDAALAAVLVLSDEAEESDKMSRAIAAAKSVAGAKAPAAESDVTLSPGTLQVSVRLAGERPALLGDLRKAHPERMRVFATAAFSKPSSGTGAEHRLGGPMRTDRAAEIMVARPRG
jgi:hypothetical protein